MVLSAAGGVDHQQLTQLAEKHFGGLNNQYDSELPEVHQARFTAGDVSSISGSSVVHHHSIIICKILEMSEIFAASTISINS